MGIHKNVCAAPQSGGWVGLRSLPARRPGWLAGLALASVALASLAAPDSAAGQSKPQSPIPVSVPVLSVDGNGKAAPEGAQPSVPLPPQVIQAQRFLAQRGFTRDRKRNRAAAGPRRNTARPEDQPPSTATWQPLGPTAVLTPNYGLVTGRVTAVALDPSDSTGNRLYVGTTGGGVWVAQNAATSIASNVVFTPLTDTLAALSDVRDASISIGALTVQPGATGAILAGTGDPNDALDSYYGAGILRSPDGGNTWTLIQTTADFELSFIGEGFAGFAWSTLTPQTVVAAVSQAYEGTLVNATQPKTSYEGLYYSLDSGVTWNLATISDGSGADVQGPSDPFAAPDGNAATSVVWNPVRQLFVAAIRFHGYYQSTDGIHFTRMTAQPGTGLSTQLCPTNPGSTGSIDCPIFRGTVAVNPQTGDTFTWTVNLNNQNQGLWQDQCAITSGVCGNTTISFSKQWNTSALDTNTSQGPATIPNGDYTLALAAMPAGPALAEDTILLAGDADLWRCSLAMGCAWRNTTNAATCMSAQVAGYQHTIGWSATNPLEVFAGNDGGLWRSMDGVSETGQVCAPTDASHFQNLNGSLGSLAEVVSMSQAGVTPYTLMTGLGVNGTAGVKGAPGPTLDWPQILGGDGGPVEIDPADNTNWFVNAESGVSIYLCAQADGCTPAAFGASPVVTDSDTGDDGYAMTTPAPFLVDPLDTTQLLIGTCRVWRGPANGVGWGGANAISPILDSQAAPGPCNGDALIRSMAALPLSGGKEVVYVGTYGESNGGTQLPRHILSATINPAANSMPVWQDLTLNPVTNDSTGMNAYGFDISSIFVDPHDATGQTIYVTEQGEENPLEEVRVFYGSTDGGAHWQSLNSNLPWTPASSVVVDPQDANTVYVATDDGVYFTREIADCANSPSTCWAAFGTGLPLAPVVAVSASASAQVLLAATYGRGVWQTPLATATTVLTTASFSPTSLTFAGQVFGTNSSALPVTLANTGSLLLLPGAIAITGDFSETDNCQNTTVAAGANCTIQVTFTPTATGSRSGQMTIPANISGGQLTVDLSGTGLAAGTVTLTPASVSFGQVEVGTTSAPLQVEAGNSSGAAIPITALTITAPFSISSNSCGATSLAADTDCQMMVEFSPTASGPATGTLTLTDSFGTETVALSGTGAAPPTDILAPSSLAFPGTIQGLLSAPLTVSLTNSGDLILTSIAISASGAFQTSNTCGTQLIGHASCIISVVFAPTLVGPATGTLTVYDLLRTQTVALSGTGLQPPALSVSPSSLSFASQQVGVASAPSMLTVSNTGGAPMANVGFQVTGPAAVAFTTGTTTCAAALANGSSCTVQVIFTPAAGGGSAATLVVSSSTLGVAVVSVPLNGTGQVASGLQVNPAQLTFPAVVPGQSSAAQTVTVSNTASIAASSLLLSVSSQFSMTLNTCPVSLASGASCSVGIVFQPTAGGTVTGALTVTSATITTPASVALSGVGGGLGAIQATPATLSFGQVGVGTSSSAIVVTVTNPTASGLSNLAFATTTGFSLANNTCAPTLGAGASCTVGVIFAPVGSGALTGSLTITSTTASASAVVSLAGTGLDFTLGSVGSASVSVSSGQTADFKLSIAPLNGSQGTLTFQCGTLPANASCAFNPTTETLNAGVTGNVTVEIATGQSLTVARSYKPIGWGAIPVVCGLLLLPLGWWKRRRALIIGAVLAILMGSVSSCASSGGGSGGGPGGGTSGEAAANATPAGTYTIPVTVTSSGVQHSVNVTLTVD